MTFSVKKAIEDADLQPFDFEDANGNPAQLPHLRTLTPRQGIRMFYDGEIEEVLEEIDPAAARMFLDLPSHVSDRLMAAWMEHSDVELPGGAPGKSARFSRSSRSTGTPSKRTSHSKGSRSRR